MTYQLCKKVIDKGAYGGSKEEMQVKLDVFLLNDRITQAEYEELTSLLANI